MPETASANDIYNSFSPSVIKGGLDSENNKKSSKLKKFLYWVKLLLELLSKQYKMKLVEVALPEELSKNGEHFGLKVSGDSMIEAGINDGDTIIVKKTNTANNGQIVVALIDGHEAMLKRIRKKGKVVALESANKKYETKIFGPR